MTRKKESQATQWRRGRLFDGLDATIYGVLLRYDKDYKCIRISNSFWRHISLSVAKKIALVAKRAKKLGDSLGLDEGLVRKASNTSASRGEVDSLGNIRIGCTVVQWNEINRLAKKRGWW